jgi:hypothetical protein
VISFTPRPLYTREKNAGTHWTAGRTGPRISLDAVEKRKSLLLSRIEPQFPGRSTRRLITILTELVRRLLCCTVRVDFLDLSLRGLQGEEWRMLGRGARAPLCSTVRKTARSVNVCRDNMKLRVTVFCQVDICHILPSSFSTAELENTGLRKTDADNTSSRTIIVNLMHLIIN